MDSQNSMVSEAAAAAGVQTDKLERIIDTFLDDYEMVGDAEDGRDACHQPTEGERILIKDAILGLLANDEWDAAWGAHISSLAASPVAPVGAPTLSDEQIKIAQNAMACAHSLCPSELPHLGKMRWMGEHVARALLSRQGCELATDATKQLREPSVHLAVNDGGQDFRGSTALPTSAPRAEVSEVERAEQFFDRTAKDKGTSIAFLKGAGILDASGQLAAPYRDDTKEQK